jgi:hypothetical protein
MGQRNALCPRITAQMLGQMRQGSVEVVDRRQQLAQSVLSDALTLVCPFPIDAPLVVQKIRALALQLFETALFAVLVCVLW